MMTNQPAPVAPEPKTKVARFHKFGLYMVCDICNLTIAYCKGHALPEMSAGDGAESNLKQRIADVQASR